MDNGEIMELIKNYLKRIYFSYYFPGELRTFYRHIKGKWFLSKDDKAVYKLRNIIKDSEKLYVQFPVLPWNIDLFQRPQQMAKAFAELGYTVIYFTPIEENIVLQKITDNLFVTNQYILLKDIKNSLVSVYLNYPPGYLNSYLNNEFFRDNYVYCEYVDHIDVQIWGGYLAKVMKQRFAELSSKYRAIVATSDVLYKEVKFLNNNIRAILVENGVDIRHYSNIKSKKAIAIEPEIQQAVKQGKRIIGYFGAIAPWLWDEILVDLADARPDLFILLIGPIYGNKKCLVSRKNILYTGSKNYNLLPHYAQLFDVSIIPFRLGEIARTTSPLKLFEYFQIGKPVVVTSDLLECTKFEGVYSASCSEEFINKIEEVLNLSKEEISRTKEKYNKYARDNSWGVRCETIIRELI